MAAFHVFVEGATDATPEGVERLAQAIGRHYGLPAESFLARLQKGRFKVKSNTDRETADTYHRDLERLGAVCTIEEATAANSQRATPFPFPAVRPATPPVGVPAARPSNSILPPAPANAPARPAHSSLPPPQPRASTPPPVGGFTSGLSAAFSSEQPAANLGALAGGGDIPFSLSSVDGTDNEGGTEAAFEPPAAGLPASIGPAPDKAKAPAKKDRPKDEPLDLFAPPDQQGEEFQVNVASDEIEHSARKRSSTPPPMETVPQPRAKSEPVARKSQPSLQVPNVTATPSSGTAVVGGVSAPTKLGLLGNEKVRFAAGLVLAILLGFVPAHFVAEMREQSAYEEIDQKVQKAQLQADTPELYAALDKTRADAIDRKEAERRNAAIIAFAIWAIAGGGIAFLWFKKIPWDSFE